jgi:energy-coupling factor transport system ATP-binding protein
VTVLGKNTAQVDPFEARAGVAAVFQNPDDQLVCTYVADDIAFGPQNAGAPAPEVAARVDAALAAVGMSGFERRKTHGLSGGQKQRVALAGAIAMAPDLLMLDEATSMLDGPAAAKIMQAVCALVDQGTAVVMVTHNPQEALMSNRVIYLQAGRVKFDCQSTHLPSLAPELFDPITLKNPPYAKGVTCKGPAKIAAQICSATYTYPTAKQPNSNRKPAIENVTLTINQGEFVAILGHTGSGKSTLVQHLNGLICPDEGTVSVLGTPTNTKAGAAFARKHVAIMNQFPETQFVASNVFTEIAFAPKNFGKTAQETHALVQKYMAAVGLDYTQFAQRNPFKLSGGQQRRVALAAALAQEATITVLDEPCAGLDWRARAEILQLLHALHAQGATFVMVTHNAEDARLLADKTLRITNGHLENLAN